MIRNTYTPCLVEFMHCVTVTSVDHVCLPSVLIAKAFNYAYKQQQETGIRDLGRYAALLPFVGLPPDSYTQ